jgi:hypothetical protein
LGGVQEERAVLRMCTFEIKVLGEGERRPERIEEGR